MVDEREEWIKEAIKEDENTVDKMYKRVSAMDPGNYTTEHAFDECKDSASVGATCPSYLHCQCGYSPGYSLHTNVESDIEFRNRIFRAYGMWGAFCTEVIESSGVALDDCGRSIGLTRGVL